MFAVTYGVELEPQLEDNFPHPTRRSLDAALEEVRSNGWPIKKGDFVSFSKIPADRNEGMTMFDGTRLVNLNREVSDEYGAVPMCFEAISGKEYFPVNYWHDSPVFRHLVHNIALVPFDPVIFISELQKNLREEKEMIYSSFVDPHSKVKYRIYLDEDDNNGTTADLLSLFSEKRYISLFPISERLESKLKKSRTNLFLGSRYGDL